MSAHQVGPSSLRRSLARSSELRKRSHDELERGSALALLVADVARAVVSSPSLDHLVREVTLIVAKGLDARYVGLWTFVDDGELALRARSGVSEGKLDAYGDELYEDVERCWTGACGAVGVRDFPASIGGMKSVVLPLAFRQSRLGIFGIVLTDCDARTFTALETIGHTVATGIQHRFDERSLILAHRRTTDLSREKSRLLAETSTRLAGWSKQLLTWLTTKRTVRIAEDLELVGQINETARDLREAAEELRDGAVIDPEHVSLSCIPFSVGDVVTSALAGREATYDIVGKAGGYVVGDPRRVRQVIEGLTDTALRAANGGPVQLRVAREHAGLAPTDTLLFSVRCDTTKVRESSAPNIRIAACEALATSMSGELSVDDDALFVRLCLPRTEMSDTAVDLKGLAERAGDPELVREILEAFIESAPSLLTAVRTAIRANDRRAFSFAAHRLRGTLLAVGAQACAARSARLEELAQGAFDVDRATEEVDMLEIELEGAVSHARVLLVGAASPS